MNVMYRKPQTGKTTELIKKSAKDGGYICCFSEEMAGRIFKQAHDMGLIIPYPITHADLLDKRYYEKGIGKIYIDNAEYLIQRIAQGVKVDMIVFDDYSEK